MSSAETMIALRLTCRTLELATFDRFVATYFGVRQCHILSMSSWVEFQKRLRDCPRLAHRARRVVLNTNVLATCYKKELQLAPARRFNNVASAQNDAHRHLNDMAYRMRPTQGAERPDLAIMTQVLRELHQLSPNAEALVNLIARGRPEKPSLHGDLLVALSCTTIVLSDIRLSHTSAAAVEECFAHHKSNLLSRTSSLKHFHFERGTYQPAPGEVTITEQRIACIREIIESARQLICLSLDLRSYRRHEDAVMATYLLASSASSLKYLRLSDMAVPEDSLISFLLQCSSSLEYLSLRTICLSPPVNKWPCVFQNISGMPRLQRLHLNKIAVRSFLPSRVSNISFQNIHVGEKSNRRDKIKMVGQEIVLAGLRDLMSQPLPYA